MSGKQRAYTTTIQTTHLDSFNHVNNARYLDLLEDARWDFMRQGDYGPERVSQTGLAPIVLEIHIKYLKELRLQDTISIETLVLDGVRKIGQMQQKIWRGHTLCAEALIKFALFDLNTRKIVPPTPAWCRALGVASD